MKNIIRIVENILNAIEKENEILTARGWEREIEEYLTTSLKSKITENDILDFIKSIKFKVDCNFEGVFREIRTEINDVYASVDISFTINEGLEYNVQTDIDVTLDFLNEERVFDAIEILIPERLHSIALQWRFWDVKGKREFVENELKSASNIEALERVLQIINDPDVKEEEEKIKSAILLVIKDNLDLSIVN